MFGSKRITTIAATALVLGMGFSAGSFADDKNVQLAINSDTVVLFGKSDITEGGVTGFDCVNYTTGVAADCVDGNGDLWAGVGFPANPATIHWAYSGDVYAVEVDDKTGEMKKKLGEKIGTVTGTPSFPASFGVFTMTGDPLQASQMVQSETLPWTCTSCNLEINGSTFKRIENMPLTGRSFIGLGGVDSEEGYLALRMAGCAGIQETSGLGDYANMKGTICLNGTIGFNPDFSGVGTSNCVMVLQKGSYVSPLAAIE